MPSAFAVLRMLEGFQYALSRTTSTVSGRISEFAPPMTPATDTGFDAVAHHHRRRRDLMFLAVERRELLPLARLADHELAAFQQAHSRTRASDVRIRTSRSS